MAIVRFPCRTWPRTLWPALALALAALGAASAADVGAAKSDLIPGLLPTVVAISTMKVDRAAQPPASAAADQRQPGPKRQTVKAYVGSGFVIDPSGLIVTNYHVVEDAFEITVTMFDGTRLAGKTLYASRIADLAMVKVDTATPLKAAHWGDSDQLQVGDQVFAAGDPFGLGLSVSAGIVSGLNRDIQNSPYDDLIQTDATINHGNSGGPLFDMQGNVIGVDSAIISPTAGSAGLGFAIPSNTARFVLGRLRTYGWIRPGWIGVKLQQVTPDMAKAAGMAQAEGSIVAWVNPDGPAHAAGLQVGDVILRSGGLVPTDERALLRSIAHTEVGDGITLSVRQHDGSERDLAVKVGEWPRDQWELRDAPAPVQRPALAVPPGLGLSLAASTAKDRARLDLPAGQPAVLVTAVAAGSDPAEQGVAAGDAILRLQDTPVATPADVLAGLRSARAGKREFVLVLVWPKVRETPGPKWVALRLGPPAS
jgi:serine protease Do